MKELGGYEEEGHRKVGRFAQIEGVDKFFTIGELTKYALDEAISNGMHKGDTSLAREKDELI